MGLKRFLGLTSNFDDSVYYKELAESISRDTQKGAAKRRYYFRVAGDYLEGAELDLVRGKKVDYTLEDIDDLKKDISRAETFECRRLVKCYDVKNPDALLPDRTRILRQGGRAALLTLGLGIVLAGAYGGKNWKDNYDNSKKAKEELTPLLEIALRDNKVAEAENLYRELLLVRNKLSIESYPEIWNNAERLEEELNLVKRVLKARDKFTEAEKLAGANNYVEALRLLGDYDGVNALIAGVEKTKLPGYKRPEFEELVAKVSKLNEACSKYKSESNKFNPIKDDLPKFATEIAALEEIVNKGELFDLEKTNNLLHAINSYLADLATVSPDAVGGHETLQQVKTKLIEIREAIEGKKGLLTKYELVEYDRVKKESGAIKNTLDLLAETQYVEEGLDGEIKKIKDLLNTAKNNLRQVDNSRVDSYELFYELGNLETKLENALNQVQLVARLKDSLAGSEDERINAALELTKRYFERDFKQKKWDRVHEVLQFLPFNKRKSVETIADIVDFELSLDKPEGQMLVREGGFTKHNLGEYMLRIDIYNDKKDDNSAKEAVLDLLKKTNLEEGREALKIVDEFISKKKDLSGEALENENKKVLDALNKFREAAEDYLKGGDIIPNLEKLGGLVGFYSRLGKKEIAEEYKKKIEELKKKYGLE